MWRKNARCIPFPVKKQQRRILNPAEKWPLTIRNGHEYPPLVGMDAILKTLTDERENSMYVYDNHKYEKALKDKIEKLEKKVADLEKENIELKGKTKRYSTVHEECNSSLSIQSNEVISYVVDNDTNSEVVSVKTGNKEMDKYIAESVCTILNKNHEEAPL